MKKILILMMLASAAGVANAQKISEKNVPQHVTASFSKLYPSIPGAKWEKENENFEAGFKVNGAERSVLFDPKGAVLETEVEIPVSDLPAAVRQYISRNYKGQNVKEAAKITDAAGRVTYEAELKGKDLLFDSSGSLVSANN